MFFFKYFNGNNGTFQVFSMSVDENKLSGLQSSLVGFYYAFNTITYKVK